MSSPQFDKCSAIKEIAVGGQKVVYKADHEIWGKVVVKKGKTSGTSGKARIEREITLLSSISSIYYPKQFSFKTKQINTAESEFVIIEEFIEGQTLRNVMGSFRSEESILSLLQSLLEGLKLIWYNPNGKTVHRDLKPENLIIRPDKSPCILDLGIARLLQEHSLTPSQYPYGPCTPQYASPEQLRNEKKLIDVRSDFFSLGIIVAELALGHHPFDPLYLNTSKNIPENILAGSYFDLSQSSNISKKLIGLIEKMLRPNPFERFRKADSIFKYINS